MKEQIIDLTESDYFSQISFRFYNNYLIYWYGSGYYLLIAQHHFLVFPFGLTLFDITREQL